MFKRRLTEFDFYRFLSYISVVVFIVMAAHSNGQAIIFCSRGFYLSSFFFFFPRGLIFY